MCPKMCSILQEIHKTLVTFGQSKMKTSRKKYWKRIQETSKIEFFQRHLQNLEKTGKKWLDDG